MSMYVTNTIELHFLYVNTNLRIGVPAGSSGAVAGGSGATLHTGMATYLCLLLLLSQFFGALTPVYYNMHTCWRQWSNSLHSNQLVLFVVTALSVFGVVTPVL